MSKLSVKIARISNSGNSAMVTVKKNDRSMEVVNAYTGLLPDEIIAAKEGKLSKGDSIEIDAGYHFVEKNDEDGEVMRYEDENPVQFLEW